MRRTSARALLGAAVIGIATIAFPVAAVAAPDVINSEPGDTCDKVHPDLTKINQASGSFTDADEHGSITWSGSTLAYDLNEGWTLDVCLKAGNSVERTNGLTGTGDVDVTVQQAISHMSYGLDYEEPAEVCAEGTDRAGEPVGNEPCNTPDPVCDEGTDRAGEPVGNEPCNTPEDLCPDGTDRAGEPVGNEPCNTPDPVCDEGTDRAGEPVGSEPCNTPEDLCPDGTVNEGQPVSEVEDCDTAVGGVVVTPEPEPEPEPEPQVEPVVDTPEETATPEAEVPLEVAGVVQQRQLPRTGPEDVPALLLAGLVALGIGAGVLRTTTRRALG